MTISNDPTIVSSLLVQGSVQADAYYDLDGNPISGGGSQLPEYTSDTTIFISTTDTGPISIDDQSSDDPGVIINSQNGEIELELGGNPVMIMNADGITLESVVYPEQQTTADAPAWILGGVYFDTTLNKLRVGGVDGWETVTSA
jgi:hypothetical protein